MTFRLKVEWKAVILAKGQNSRGQKCTKSVFLTTNFGQKYLVRSVQKLSFGPNSMVRNDQHFRPQILSDNVASNCNMKL